MANHFYSTGYFIPKAPTSFTHTPVTRAFAAMLQALSAYIDSERDLEHVDSFDPAVDNWVADAERNRVAMFAALDRLRDTRLTRALDVPLRRMGMVTRLLIDCETSASFFNLLKSVDQHADLFACPGEDPVARRLRQMIDAAKAQLNALAQLAEHSDVIDVDFTISEPMDLAPVA